MLSLKAADLLFGVLTDNNKNYVGDRSINMREFSPNLDTVRRPSARDLEDTEGLEIRDNILRTDENGFIKGPGNNSKKPDILFFGGSTTENGFVPENLRFPYLVSTLISSPNEEKINTLNAGVSANNSMHSLLNLIAKGIPAEPSFIVLMHGVNDAVLLAKTGTYWDAPSSRSIINVPPLLRSEEKGFRATIRGVKNLLVPNIWQFLKVTPFLEQFLDKYWNLKQSNDDFEGFRYNSVTAANAANALRNEFRSTLTSFVLISREFGIEPILMTQPNRIENKDPLFQSWFKKRDQSISVDEFRSIYILSNKITRQVAVDQKVALIDLAIEIGSNPRSFYDPVHLNEFGNIEAAKIISEGFSKKFPKNFILVEKKVVK